MPNWCTNTVEIEGKPEDVKEVVDFLGEDKAANRKLGKYWKNLHTRKRRKLIDLNHKQI